MTTKHTPEGWNAQPAATAPKINDGGPAFPAVYEGSTLPDAMGKTLRDDFAGKAMQAQLTAFWAMETHHGWSHDEIAREAYAMADAMLAARGAQ